MPGRPAPRASACRLFCSAAVRLAHVIYPPEPLRALRLTPLAETRVLILGQDPYHGPGPRPRAWRSRCPRVSTPPPSLRNLFKELQRDLGQQPPMSPHLGAWARRGVLLAQQLFHGGRRRARQPRQAGLGSPERRPDRRGRTRPGAQGFHALGRVRAGQGAADRCGPGPGRRAALRTCRPTIPSPLSALRPPSAFHRLRSFQCGRRLFWRSTAAPLDWSLD